MPRLIRHALDALASLKLTVALFALAMVLIFAGTLAQVHAGIWQVMADYFRTPIAWIDLQLFVPEQLATVHGSLPFPGGYLLGGLLIVNLLAAHVARFKLTAKRAGIVVLHAGVIVLLVGEFVTGMFAEEGLMTIYEGGYAQYVEDVREAELVVVDRSAPERDHVVAVPERMLTTPGKTIAHAALPFEITVDRWLPNARLRRMTPGETNALATHGAGTQLIARSEPLARGVDGNEIDLPAAYVTLHHNGEPMGTWLLAELLEPTQSVDVDGRTYHLDLRFKRTYKPYTLHLLEFRHDRFVGTERPRNFASHIRLVDPTQNEDREVVISMNNPLRYAGATFYQSAYKEDDVGTVLQVVRNPGWLLPYIACALVALGMGVHFVMRLWQFVGRGASASRAPAPALPPVDDGRGSATQRALPWVVAALALVYLVAAAQPASVPGEYDLRQFGAIPVSADGRVKPLDTVARTNLMILSGRQRFELDGERYPAIRWLADVMARRPGADHYPVLRVDHPDVQSLLGRDEPTTERFSLVDVLPHWRRVVEQAQRAVDVPGRQRNAYQRQVLKLYRQVSIVMETAHMQAPYMVPPTGPDEQWAPFAPIAHDSRATGEMHPAVEPITAMLSAYHRGEPAEFNAAVERYRGAFVEHMPAEARRAGYEVFFNDLSPFYHATALYVIAFLLAAGSLLLRCVSGSTWAGPLAQAALALVVVTFVLHTFGLASRIYLQGRPPVTNLYSSAVFVGWGTVLLAILVERFHRLGLATLAAAATGFVTLIIAHNLAGDGDTMEMMQAVLDSNFWLATHVITITIGYSATFLAGLLAIVYLVLGTLTPWLTRDMGQALGRMVYGTVCFALLLSFTGTVLGGIWADQSWGRFWGWDPKENGAALIVLVHAIILHARWGGLIQHRGMMVLAVAGNIVTAWAWFGTNMLGVGLHSYGFMESAMFWLFAFVVSQLAIMGLGMLPPEWWRSASGLARAGAARPVASAG